MANKNTATVERNAEQVEGQVETTEGVQENQVEGQVESAEQAPKPNPDLTPYEAAKVITAAVRKRHPERSDFTMQPQRRRLRALAEGLPQRRVRRSGHAQHRLQRPRRHLHAGHPGRGRRPGRAGRAGAAGHGPAGRQRGPRGRARRGRGRVVVRRHHGQGGLQRGGPPGPC